MDGQIECLAKLPTPSMEILASAHESTFKAAADAAQERGHAIPPEAAILHAERELQQARTQQSAINAQRSARAPQIAVKKVYASGERSLTAVQKAKRAQWRAKRADRKRRARAKASAGATTPPVDAATA